MAESKQKTDGNSQISKQNEIGSPSHESQTVSSKNTVMSSLSSWSGPRTVIVKRCDNGFGFTLRHFIVYPPESALHSQFKENENFSDRDGEAKRKRSKLSALEPMDTIFVKHVKEGGPAQQAGLSTGDRIISVNGESVTGKTYSQVIQLIQASDNKLQLLVVPKDEDILQLAYSSSAYNQGQDIYLGKPHDSSNLPHHAIPHNYYNQICMPSPHLPRSQSLSPTKYRAEFLSAPSNSKDHIKYFQNFEPQSSGSFPQNLTSAKADDLGGSQEVLSNLSNKNDKSGWKDVSISADNLQKIIQTERQPGVLSFANAPLLYRSSTKHLALSHFQKLEKGQMNSLDVPPNNANVVFQPHTQAKEAISYSYNSVNKNLSPPRQIVEPFRHSSNSLFEEQKDINSSYKIPLEYVNRFQQPFLEQKAQPAISSWKLSGSTENNSNILWKTVNPALEKFSPLPWKPSQVSSDSNSAPTWRSVAPPSSSGPMGWKSVNSSVPCISSSWKPVTFSPDGLSSVSKPISFSSVSSPLRAVNPSVENIRTSKIKPLPDVKLLHTRSSSSDTIVTRAVCMPSRPSTAPTFSAPIYVMGTTNKISQSSENISSNLGSSINYPKVSNGYQNHSFLVNNYNENVHNSHLSDCFIPPVGRTFNSNLDRIQENLTSVNHQNIDKPWNSWPGSVTYPTSNEYPMRSSAPPLTTYTTKFVPSSSSSPTFSTQTLKSNDSVGSPAMARTTISGVTINMPVESQRISTLQLVSQRAKKFENTAKQDIDNVPRYRIEPKRIIYKGASSVAQRTAQFENRSAGMETISTTEMKGEPRRRISVDHYSVDRHFPKLETCDLPNRDVKSPSVLPSITITQVNKEDNVMPFTEITNSANNDELSFKAVRQNSYLSAIQSTAKFPNGEDFLPATCCTSTPSIATLTANDSAGSSVILRNRSVFGSCPDVIGAVPIAEDEDLKGVRRTSYLKATSSEDFEGDDQMHDKVLPLRSPSIQKLKAFFGEKTPKIMEATERSKDLANPLYDIIKEGILHCKTALTDGKRSSDRSWKPVWAVLRGHALYLHKDKKDAFLGHILYSILAAGKVPPFLFFQSPMLLDDQPISIKSSIVDIAYDYTKKKNVFRLTTFNGSEYLLQAENHKNMLSWIQAIQANNNPDEDEKGVTSMDLIMRKSKFDNVLQTAKLSPQIPHKPSKKLSFRHRSPITLSPSIKPRKISQGDENIPPKNKTWKGKMVRSLRRISNMNPVPVAANSENVPQEGVTIGVLLDDCPPSGNNEFVPLLVEICTSIVELKGLDVVGIYRIPGNTAAVSALQEQLNRGMDNLNLDDVRWTDVNVVSSLLKAFFRKLPEPLVPSNMYHFFIEANKIENPTERMCTLKKLLQHLPDYHYDTFKHMAHHLRKIASNGHQNKMEVRNLAIVFGPTLVRTADDNMATMVTDMAHQCRIVETIITHADWFFNNDDCDDLANQNVPVDLVSCDTQPTQSDVNLLLNNIGKAEDAISAGSSDSSKSRDVIAKDIVTSIISAANKKRKKKEKKDLYVWSEDSDHSFQERSIDHEIEMHQLRQQNMIKSLRNNSSSNPELSSGTTLPLTVTTNSNLLISKPEENIYTARRIFIENEEDHNILVKNNFNDFHSCKSAFTPYVSVPSEQNPPIRRHSDNTPLTMQGIQEEDFPRSYRMLSSTTQERIRRFELETKALLQRDIRQKRDFDHEGDIREIQKREEERKRIEVEWEQAKKDLETEDFLDKLADNPSELALKITDYTNRIRDLESKDRSSQVSNGSQTKIETSSVDSHYSTNFSSNNIISDCKPQYFAGKPSSYPIISPLSYRLEVKQNNPATKSDSRIIQQSSDENNTHFTPTRKLGDTMVFPTNGKKKAPSSFQQPSSHTFLGIKIISPSTTNVLSSDDSMFRKTNSMENIELSNKTITNNLSETIKERSILQRHQSHESSDLSDSGVGTLPRPASLRRGSLDSLRDFYEVDPPCAFSSSEEDGDLLESITNTLDQKLQKLLGHESSQTTRNSKSSAKKGDSLKQTKMIRDSKSREMITNNKISEANSEKAYSGTILHKVGQNGNVSKEEKTEKNLKDKIKLLQKEEERNIKKDVVKESSSQYKKDPDSKKSADRHRKRRHTVGGAKDFEWFKALLTFKHHKQEPKLSAWDRLQPVVKDYGEGSEKRSLKAWLTKERLRTSTPDLSVPVRDLKLKDVNEVKNSSTSVSSQQEVLRPSKDRLCVLSVESQV